MTIQLRQICLVAHELESVIDDLRSILGINSCYVDPGVGKFGLENNLMPIGRNFLEVVAPIQENTAGGRYLDKRGGDGGYMVIAQVENLIQEQVRLANTSIRSVFADDRGNAKAIHLHPRDLSLIHI